MQLSSTTSTTDIFNQLDYHPKVRDPESRRILIAARRVMERSRFQSLKVRQVLTASGSSATIFYRRFPSKAHLLLALLEDEVQLVDRQLRDRIVTTAPFPEQLLTWLRFNLGAVFNETDVQRNRLFLDQDLVDGLPEQVRVLFASIDKQLSEIIWRGMSRGEVRMGDPDADAVLVGHLMRGLLMGGLVGGLPSDKDAFIMRVHDFVLRSLGHTSGVQAQCRAGCGSDELCQGLLADHVGQS